MFFLCFDLHRAPLLHVDGVWGVSRLYKKKAFLHWYFDEGMDEDNFDEASMKIEDLIHEYQDRTDVQFEVDGGGFEPPDEDEDDIMAKYLHDSEDGGGAEEFDPDEFQPPGGDEEGSVSLEPWD